LFREAWKRAQTEGPPLEKTDDAPEQLAEQGAGLVEAYLHQIDPDERVLDYNRAFAVPVGASEKPLIGEIDCVVETGGGLELVDWKTSARRWPKDQAEKSLQPTAYLYGAEQFRPGAGCARFRFDVAVKNKTPVVERNYTTRSPEDFARLERLVATAERIVAHELYYPSEQSFVCAGCAFREPCKAWHRMKAA
jgi:CRISPR/Cas system-associated exonuclease Cas4 (RecB family)